MVFQAMSVRWRMVGGDWSLTQWPDKCGYWPCRTWPWFEDYFFEASIAFKSAKGLKVVVGVTLRPSLRPAESLTLECSF